MLNVGCWKGRWDRELKMLAKGNISTKQQQISPDCPISSWIHDQRDIWWLLLCNLLERIMGIEHRMTHLLFSISLPPSLLLLGLTQMAVHPSRRLKHYLNSFTYQLQTYVYVWGFSSVSVSKHFGMKQSKCEELHTVLGPGLSEHLLPRCDNERLHKVV